MRRKTYVIAEAGVNHNGDINNALKLIDVAATSGADAIKFQLFTTNKLATKYVNKAKYQIDKSRNKNQYNMLKSLELTKQSYIKLHKYAVSKKIDFLCTAFDSENLKYLIEKKIVKILKIGSGEITNAPLLLEHAKKDCSIILSTGMSNIEEIEKALGVIAFGFLNVSSREKPNLEKFYNSFNSVKGKEILKKRVSLLHCTTEYPAPDQDLNLKAIKSMKKYFNLDVGFSDHSKGFQASIVSVLLGAKIIEKHFTLDKKMEGPDHKASLEPKELKDFISNIRKIENLSKKQVPKLLNAIKNINVILGDGVKEAKFSELKNINIARRYLVAKTNINIGDIFSKNNLTCKRSKKGISPFSYWNYIGKKSQKKYLKDEIIV